MAKSEHLEADKKLFAIQVDRYTKLAAKSAASQQDVDQYRAQQAQNIGSLKSAQAQVEHGQAESRLHPHRSPHHRKNQPHADHRRATWSMPT